ncbi:MAG: rhodanese-like domain-containing protein [Verrucomicrobiales bacterium]
MRNPENLQGSSGRAGSVLVALQFLALTTIALHGVPALSYWPAAAVLLLSSAFSIWAVIQMGRGTFSVHPDPSEAGQLQTRGPYRFVRHPMYAAVVAASIAVLWTNPTLLATGAFLVVLGVLHFKIRIEEAALGAKFDAFSRYVQEVPAIVPFVPRMGRPIWLAAVALCVAAPTIWLPFERRWDASLFATASISEAGTWQNMSVEEAASLLHQRSDIVVLDVRSEREAAGARLPGAVNIPSSSSDFIERVARSGISQDTPVMVYCAGGFRSRMVVARLRENEFGEIYHLHRGILSWRLCGQSVEYLK